MSDPAASRTTSHRRRRWLAPWAALTVFAALFGPATAPAGAEDDETAQEEYDEVVGDEAEALDRLAAAKQRRADHLVQVMLIEARLVETRLHLVEAEQRLVDAGIAKDRAAEDLARAESEVKRATKKLHRQVVYSYMSRDSSEAQATLLRSPDESNRVRVYAEAVADHQQGLIDGLDAAQQKRDRLSDDAEAAEDEAGRVRDDLDAARQLVEAQHQQTIDLAALALVEEATEAGILLDLQTKKIEIETRITQMQRDSDGLAMLIAAAQQDQPDWTPYSVLTVDPLPGAGMSSPFGIRFHPILHYQRLHTGQDMGASTGTPILAAADGTVLVASVRGGYGNATVIDHGNSLSTLYAHQSRFMVTVGQQVKAGQVIGLVGSTGMSTGPHLHFETRVRGIPIDPTYFVARL